MSRILRIGFCHLLAMLSCQIASGEAGLLDSFRTEVEPILDNYCYDCHGLGISEGNVTLDEFTAESIEDTDLWLRVLKNTRAHVMPPVEELQPTPEERAQLAHWIKVNPFGIEIDEPDPGHMTIQRLNRFEYQHTIRDLLGIEFDAMDEFPADDAGEGFDNIGDVLTISPMLLEKYLDAANKIIAEAVPTTARVVPESRLSGKELVALFSPAPPIDRSEDDLQLSFYHPSQRSASWAVQREGDYRLILKIKPRSFSSFSGFDYNQCRFVFEEDGEILIDQEFEFISGKEYLFEFNRAWTPGTRQFTARVEPLSFGLEKIKSLKMEIEEMAIQGPMDPVHWVAPQNYYTYFPGGIPEEPVDRRRYTRSLLADFATRAFRRPVDEVSVEELTSLAEEFSNRPGGTPEMGIAKAMVAVLASPRFIFREEGVEKLSDENRYPFIDEYALASRLSYFLWSSMPDAELLDLAANGQLRQNLQCQVERMLADEKSQRFIENFAGQWLHARDIQSVNISSYDVWLRENPEPVLVEARREYNKVREIPEFQRTEEEQATYERTRAIIVASYRKDRPELRGPVKRAMQAETELYFEHIIKEDRSLLELLDSNYTFLNEALAEHYGIEGVEGSMLRKVELEPGNPRGGILTQGTILAFTSNPTRTSPVKRGVFILENILGTPPAPPPPDVPALEDVASPEELKKLSLRETLAIHREEPLCSSCHNRMDPLGLALENFNAMGMWRDSELNQPIETGGVLITGESFDSVQEMKHILATQRKRDFYYCISEKLLTYALGRGMEYYDTHTLDLLVRDLEKNNGSPTNLIHGIVNAISFQKRRH